MTTGVCMFETVDGNPAQFRSTKDGSLQECVGGMVFVPIICGCIPDSESELKRQCVCVYRIIVSCIKRYAYFNVRTAENKQSNFGIHLFNA